MPGTFFGIEIGQRGLSASQLGQDVTGNNISNAATDGYSVEQANLAASDPLSVPGLTHSAGTSQIGSGVEVRSITRARDQYLDQQVRTASAQESDQTAQNDALKQIEFAFGEGSDQGLNAALGTLFQSFNGLVNDPENTGARASAVQNGVALASSFQDVQGRLTTISQSLASKQSTDLNALNTYGRQIAALNVSIRQQAGGGQNANQLYDQRDLLIDKVASLASVSVLNNSDGTVNVSVGTSDLVTGVDAHTLALTGPNSLTARGDIAGGDLGGAVQSQATLAGYQTDLDSLAASLISTVNSVHQQGAGTDGTTGLSFFTGTNASTIAVNPALVSDPSKLAAAAVPSGGGAPPSGDASNAANLGALQNQPVASGALAGQTLQGFYQARVSDLSAKSASAATGLASATANATQLSQQRDSVTGVSTDTEMINLLKYQRAYEASAKVVQTMDSMVSTLITGLFS